MHSDGLWISAVVRVALLVFPLYLAVRQPRRGVWVIAAFAVYVVAVLEALRGDIALSGVLATPFVALVAYVQWVYLDSHPERLRRYIAAKEEEWSHQRHDLMNDLAAAKAQAAAAELRFERRLQQLQGQINNP